MITVTKPRYASPEERRAAVSAKARVQMRAQWDAKRAAEGSEIGYFGKHRRVRSVRGRAADYPCVQCGAQARDWAQLHGTSGDDPKHYEPMCKSCHFRYDGVGHSPKQTSESRSAAARLAWSRRTPERRKEINQKSVATRRANAAALVSSRSWTG